MEARCRICCLLDERELWGGGVGEEQLGLGVSLASSDGDLRFEVAMTGSLAGSNTLVGWRWR